MASFWLAMVLLSVAATYWMLRPLLHPEINKQSRRRYNQAVFKDRLRELENERETMGLSSEEFETLKTQLKRSLLDDIPDENSSDAVAATAAPKGNAKLTVIIITLIVLGATMALYAGYGSANAVKDWQTIMRNPDLSQESLQAVLTNKKSDSKRYTVGDYLLAARTRVHENPENASVWITLAETYLRVPMRDAAESTLKRAQRQLPESAEILLAQAQVMQALDGNDSRSRLKLQAALALEPNNANVLFSNAMSSMQNNRYAQAVTEWRAFRAVLKDDDKMVRVAEQGLLAAQRKAKETQTATPQAATLAQAGAQAPSANASGRREIAINVDLAPRFLGKYKASDTVFVMAKMIKGAPMPLAVVKTTVGQLSQVIRLDESHAMMPSLTLAQHNKVEVIVRISPSGDAIASTGDLEGRVAPVDLKDGHTSSVSVILNKLIGHERVSKSGQATPGPAQAASPAPVQAKKSRYSKATERPTKDLSIQVEVSLDAKLATRVSPEDRVFVFARAVKGPKMPLAVKTARVKDLPITVSLSDADAMTPAFRLSSADEVKIVARVSRSGNAQAQAGDLEGESPILSPPKVSGAVVVKIDAEVKDR